VVVVSNHGGRQLDGAASTIEALPAVVEEAAGRMTVLIDSGFRSGADIAKALAFGADAVQRGRPTLYGLAAGGEAGVRHALRLLADELDRAMGVCGATGVAGLRGCVEHDRPRHAQNEATVERAAPSSTDPSWRPRSAEVPTLGAAQAPVAEFS
jgi:isopentenyl diphosphate isomerase/L-lactate dehydrogenase-like FMN-dependent dehydrogenase